MWHVQGIIMRASSRRYNKNIKTKPSKEKKIENKNENILN